MKQITQKEKYDYSKVEYINANTKVKIVCPEHGSFGQPPNGHLRDTKKLTKSYN